MTTEIQELSEKLSVLYGVEAVYLNGIYTKYLAEDSGRISDLADDNGVDTLCRIDNAICSAFNTTCNTRSIVNTTIEQYINHPTKHDAARMARVRCLIAIGELK